jgi:hypothetical protein
VQLRNAKQHLRPNTPLNVGLGFSIKNTFLDLGYSWGLGNTLENRDIIRSKTVDFQLHAYGKRYILDLYFQQYRGFYIAADRIEMYPDMSVRQYGAEYSYVFNGNRFSTKAAFAQGEKQLRSAGSVIGGINFYLTRIGSPPDLLVGNERLVNNIQLGTNAGYGYSYVIDAHWLLSGALTGGVNFGNLVEKFGRGDIEVSFNTFARIAIGYNRENWGVSLFFLNNMHHYSSFGRNALNLSSSVFRIVGVKRFDVRRRRQAMTAGRPLRNRRTIPYI